MNQNLIHFVTDDGCELHGILFTPVQDVKGVIVHVHGLAGNFYENRFLYSVAEAATEAGWGFFPFNNRGHDYFADILKEREGAAESVRIGGAFETFTDCRSDIDAAMATLRARGIQRIVLEGHSSGANKIVYYLAKRDAREVVGAILISGCDDVGLIRNDDVDRADRLLRTAEEMVESGNGDKLMPEGSFFSYPMSAHTFLDYCKPGAPHDVFPFREGNGNFSSLARIACPMLALYGGDGDYVSNPDEAIRILRSKATACPRFSGSVVPGAGHTYVGKEEALAKIISQWLVTSFSPA